MPKFQIRVIHGSVSIFGSHAVVATRRTIASIVRRALKKGILDLIVKTEHGCPCETLKLAASLKRVPRFGHVQIRGSAIELDLVPRIEKKRRRSA